MLYHRKGDTPKAMDLFEEGRHGGDPEAATNLGLLYEQKGDTSKGIC